jgi:hypothetical protein
MWRGQEGGARVFLATSSVPLPKTDSRQNTHYSTTGITSPPLFPTTMASVGP